MENYSPSCQSKMQQNWVTPLKILCHLPLKPLLTKDLEVTLEEGVASLHSFLTTDTSSFRGLSFPSPSLNHTFAANLKNVTNNYSVFVIVNTPFLNKIYLYLRPSSKGRGYSRFQVTGMIEWGQKSKHQKIPGPKINPPKIPMPNIRVIKISNKQIGCTFFIELRAMYPKQSRNRKLQTQKIPLSIPCTWNPK